MIGSYDIMMGDDKVGVLNISQAGLMTVFSGECRYISDKIVRVAADCGDRYVILGVLCPENGQMKFFRKYSKLELSTLGLNDITGAEVLFEGADNIPQPVQPRKRRAGEALDNINSAAERDESGAEAAAAAADKPREDLPRAAGGWRIERDPGQLFADPELTEACQNVIEALVREAEGIKYLAIPIGRNIPFPMMPIFCFGESEEIDGRAYIVFKIKDGQLSA